MSISPGLLQLYLAGALEPHEAETVAARLADDPRLQRRLFQLKGATWGLPRPSPWRIPPAALRLSGRAVPAPVLGSGAFRLGAVCRILIDFPDDAAGREVLLLRRDPEAEWQVVVPRSAQERVTLDQLDRDGSQGCVEFLARGPLGAQTWAVALPQGTLLDALDLAQGDWAPLQAEVQAGRIPLTVVDIWVEA